VDSWRESAYRKIGRIIGYGTADSNGVAKQIEEELVKIFFDNMENGTVYEMTLSDDQISQLRDEFGVGYGLYAWVPGANT